MPSDLEIEYYKSIESDWIYAAVGPGGYSGLFRITSGMKDWEYLIPETSIWNWVHQKIFRNHRADLVAPDKFGFPFPGPPNHPSSEEVQERLAALNPPLLAAGYPRVTAFLKAQPGRVVESFVVLYEDVYESHLGDGKFLYFHKAFLEKTEAQAYVDQSGSNYYLRTVGLGLDGESKLSVKLQVELWDDYDAVGVVTALEKELPAPPADAC
jgi:hypothetical protein